MSRRIFRDVEEALAREVKRITFHDSRTVALAVLEDTFDPFTGEIVQTEIEPSFYDSSADTGHIQYPHFFIKLLKTREDRFSGREVPQYGLGCVTQVTTSPKAYEIVASSVDATIAAAGDTITTSLFKIKAVQPGFLVRLLEGNNIGTYIVDSVVVDSGGSHTITLSNDLTLSLPSAIYESSTGKLVFEESVDLNTIKVGDIFEDASAVTHSITAVDVENNTVTLDMVATPDTDAGGKITRTSPVLQSIDPSLVRFIVMDPSKPVQKLSAGGAEVNSSAQRTNPEVPLDAYYLVRIDSKQRDNHVDVLNRVWEEFNPPRTGLPVITRSALSEEKLLQADITSGGSSTIDVGDNSNYNLNDPIYIFNDLQPTKSSDGKFSRPFETKVIGKTSTNLLELADVVPDTYTVSDCTKVVSHASFRLFMFHFVDHVTRDVEGAQYWSHEFTFWVQVWVDRQGDPQDVGTVTDIASGVGTIDGGIIIDDP